LAYPVFQFLNFELVTARREIRRDGETLAVEPKVYDLLLFLLERRDRAVSKEELQDAVWPSVIVTEAALTRCIMKARTLVDDDAKVQQVIRTLHGHGYRFVADVEEISGDSAVVAATPQADQETVSVAVLPFASLSDDETQRYLADGLTQDIITDLSRNPWLMVVARNSSPAPVTPAKHDELGAELGVRYLVEGSLRRHGDHLRVTASLTDALSGVCEWSERYDQSLDEFFSIQDDISQSIAGSLGSHVRRAEGKRAERAEPGSLDVWGLLHRGMSISWSRFNQQSNLEAEACYRQALELAPDNARALAFASASIAMKVANGWSDDINADRALAMKLGRRAIELLPNDAMVLASFGHANTCLGSSMDAVGLLERALQLDPSNAWIHGLYAYALTAVGRAEEAIPVLIRAMRLSPRDIAMHWYLVMLAWAYLQLDQFEDAAREAQRSINAFAGWAIVWVTLGVALAALDQRDEARRTFAVASDLEARFGREGFRRFFRFILRDDVKGDRCAANLEELWPQA
jgi:TolB-like protein